MAWDQMGKLGYLLVLSFFLCNGMQESLPTDEEIKTKLEQARKKVTYIEKALAHLGDSTPSQTEMAALGQYLSAASQLCEAVPSPHWCPTEFRAQAWLDAAALQKKVRNLANE